MSENATNEKNCRHGIDRSIVLCTDCDAAEGRFLERAELTKQINDLPEMLRQYVHDLEADADPAGDKMRIVCLEENMAGLTDEIDRQRAEIERLTRERDEARATVQLTETVTARMERLSRGRIETERDRLRAEIERLQSELAVANELIARAIGDSDSSSSDERTSEWLTDEQCDDVIAFLEDYEWSGLTRENVRTWCTAIAEARSSVKANECKPGFTQACSSFGDDPDAPGCCSYCGQPREAHPQKGPP